MEFNKDLKIRDVVKIFIPLLLAVFIQYAVSIFDLLCIFAKNIFSDKKTDSTYTVENIISMDYNQPMNLAIVNAFKFLLYIIIFGIWYYKSFIKTGKKDVTLKENIINKIKSTMTPLITVFLLIAGISGQFLVDGFLNIFRSIFEDAFKSYDDMISSVTGAGSSWLMLFSIFVLAPIAEEILFRGLLYQYSKKLLFTPFAIIFQAFMFGVYHGTVIQGIYAFAMGLVLGCVMYKFDSIVPSIFLHMVINISILFVPEALFNSIGICIVTTIVSLVIFAFALYLSLKQKAKYSINE